MKIVLCEKELEPSSYYYKKNNTKFNFKTKIISAYLMEIHLKRKQNNQNSYPLDHDILKYSLILIQ